MKTSPLKAAEAANAYLKKYKAWLARQPLSEHTKRAYRCRRKKDTAVALLLFHTGIRIGECTALNVEDVPVNLKKGKVIVRSGKGERMSSTSLDRIVRKIGEAVGLDLSPQILRHSCLTSLVRAGNDLVLVSEVAGHKRLETTKRYTLPSAGDKERAMEGLAE